MSACIECGRQFVAKHSAHILCGAGCAHRRWVKRGRRPAEPIQVRCQHCGIEFLRRNPKRRYCSEQCRDRASARRQVRDPEGDRRRSREWASRNRDRMNARYREWARMHPEMLRIRRHRRRARQRDAPGSWTVDQWEALVAEYDGRCAYCGVVALLTVDHRIPLARAGSNYVENLLPACITCNKRKGYRSEAEFRADIAAQRRGGAESAHVLLDTFVTMRVRQIRRRATGGPA